MRDRPLPGARFEPPVVRAIVRERVDRRLDRAWSVPLTTVVGPAGAGKTTAASHLVQRSNGDGVWYRAHPVDGNESVFTEHLGQAVMRVTRQEPPVTDLESLLVDTERIARRLLVVIDEFDAIIGTPSEHAFGELLVDLAPSIHFVSLSRHRPSINLSRLRVGPGLGEIGPDDLRFRSWEVAQLFGELYRRPLLPDEVAELERRTGGWVAALQLFNLATTALPASERRAAIAHVGRRSGPDWDFLADNVLSGLPDELQLFLLETAPLERLTADLCDDLLGESTSASRLAELDRLQLVTSSMEAPGTFRTHEVLRAHLDALLMEWEGADAGRKRYRRTAELLEHHGHFAEALRAFCRGEDWPSASRLLGSRGAEVADRPGRWLIGMPPAMAKSDPWLLLAVARQHRADGRLGDAIAAYQRVENAALTSHPVEVARRERLLLAALLDRSSFPALPWVAALRDAVLTDPNGALGRLGDRSAHERLATGVCQLLAGNVRDAALTLNHTRDRADASPTISLTADLSLLVANHLMGGADPLAADDLERAATALDIPFLVRLCRAAAAMVTGSLDLIDDVVDDCHRADDTAGATAAAVLGALARVWGPAAPAAVGSGALERCRLHGFQSLEVWALVAMALGGIGSADGPALAGAADTAARRRGLRPLQDLAALTVLAATTAGRVPIDVASAITTSHGIAVPASLAPASPTTATVTAFELRVYCFGRFAVERTDRPVVLRDLRPRARAVLRMLAVHLGTGVHRQRFCEELWPDDAEAAASRKLHVAISSIRRVIDGPSDVIRRHGEIYLLDADHGVVCDVHEFSTDLGEARSLISRGNAAEAEPLLRRAMSLYIGDLLPEEGAAEWATAMRRQFQSAATQIAHSLGQILLDSERPDEAVGVCRWGLAVDRYSDPLWRLLLSALAADGDLAGSALAVASYHDVLAELGIATPV